MKLANVKWTSFLKYYMLGIVLLLVGGIVGMVFMGLNLSTDFVGGTNVAVEFKFEANQKEQRANIKNLIEQKNYNVEKSYVQFEGIENVYVFVINSKDVDVIELENLIKENENVTEVSIEEAGAIVRDDYLWKTCVLVASFMLIMILYFGVQKSWVTGITSAIAFLFVISLSICAFILTRIKITLAGVAVIGIISAVASIVCAFIAERAKTDHKQKENKELNMQDMTNAQISKKLLQFGIAFGVVLVMAIVLLVALLNVKMVTYFALQLIVVVVLAFFLGVMVCPLIAEELEQIAIDNQKAKLSKNAPVVKPTVVKKRKTVKRKVSKTAKKEDKKIKV